MLPTMALVLIYLIVQMFIIWRIALKINNPGIIDVAWEIGLVVTGLIYLCTPGFALKNMVVGLLLLIWGVRLGGYIYVSRIKKGIVEKRYLMISSKWKVSQSLGFLLHFQLQGLFIFIVASVFIIIPSAPISVLDYIAAMSCCIGIIGETIADRQLNNFKKTQPKAVCNVGLWSYSRHPNLFFEFLIWLSFSLFALTAPHGWLSLISPLCVYLIMILGTIPITETGSLNSRGQAYKDYQATTPIFFPWKSSK